MYMGKKAQYVFLQYKCATQGTINRIPAASTPKKEKPVLATGLV